MTGTRTDHILLVIVTAFSLSLALAGCGDDDADGTGAAGSSTAKEPSNPVPILEKVDGCELEAGTEVGETDIDGNRYASCNFMDNSGSAGTNVTARTYPGDPKDFATADQLRGDDSHKVILGQDFIVTITGDFAAYSADVDPEVIADQVGGEYLVPS